MTTTPPPDEFGLIERLFAPLAAAYPGALGLKDDAALVEVTPGHRLVVTSDAIVANVHYLADDPPDLVARKLIRVNLSDLAAMGARPVALLLAAAFARTATAEWLEAFAAGLAADTSAFGVPLIGGDTVATPGLPTFALTALGEVEAGRALLRSGACVGDDIWVSGTIGDGALGLMVLQGVVQLPAPLAAFAADRYRLPRPRLPLGQGLVGVANAALDVSDGLCADLGHICDASGVGAVVEATRVPLSAAGRAAVDAAPSLLVRLLCGGDDYELLFTAPPSAAAAIAGLGHDVPVTRIGRIVAGSGVQLHDAAGQLMVLPDGGYRHFRGSP